MVEHSAGFTARMSQALPAIVFYLHLFALQKLVLYLSLCVKLELSLNQLILIQIFDTIFTFMNLKYWCKRKYGESTFRTFQESLFIGSVVLGMDRLIKVNMNATDFQLGYITV